MTYSPRHIPGFVRLAAQWRVLGLMALVLARECVRLQRGGQSRDIAKAEMLEVWLRLALFQLPQQIRAHCDGGGALTEEEEGALAHLYSILGALAKLLLLLNILKLRRIGSVGSDMCSVEPGIALAYAGRKTGPAFIDTS